MMGKTNNGWNSPMRMLAGMLSLALIPDFGYAGKSVATEGVRPEPYACALASGPIAIDGRIDEEAWKNVAPITTFNVYSPKNAENLSPTEARILWDSENLYLAIFCADLDIWSYSDEPDAELWLGDVAEFFVKPDHDSPTYYEFVVAPNGTLFDACYPSRGAGGFRRFKGWSSNARVAVDVDGTDGDCSDSDKGYTMEMAIPLSAFQGGVSPAESVVWTFGICRCDYSKLYDAPLRLMTMFQTPSHGFHFYEGYADLVFSKAVGLVGEEK